MPQDNTAAAVHGVPIAVKVTLHASPTGETPPPAVAYAFTGTGHFITKAALDDTGSATLTVPAGRTPREIRVVIGPDVTEQQTTVGELTRRAAPMQFLRVHAEARGLQASFEIPSPIWLCWIRFCLVQGTLMKRLFSGGLPVDYPVCGAEIQIWEVEPLIIILSKISDLELQKVRQFLLNPQPLPPVEGQAMAGPAGLALLGRLETARPVATTERFSPTSVELPACAA
jgi:hypothetical protein